MNTNERYGSSLHFGPEALEITDEKFNMLFDNHRRMIEDTSIGLDAVPPCINICFRRIKDNMPGDIEGAIIIIDSDFNDPESRRRIMTKIGRKCCEQKWLIVAVIMSSEAWMSVRPVDKPDPEVMPSQDPNRKECIMISGRTLMGECKIGYMIPIKRDKDNKILKDGETVSVTNAIDTNIIDHLLRGFADALKENNENI